MLSKGIYLYHSLLVPTVTSLQQTPIAIFQGIQICFSIRLVKKLLLSPQSLTASEDSPFCLSHTVQPSNILFKNQKVILRVEQMQMQHRECYIAIIMPYLVGLINLSHYHQLYYKVRGSSLRRRLVSKEAFHSRQVSQQTQDLPP